VELLGKVDDRRGAAKGRRLSARFKGVAGVDIVAHGGFHVDMGINAPR
jgi:hypothetical protein